MKPTIVALICALALASGALASDIPKDLLTQRDPFKMPVLPQASIPQSELELFPTTQYKLVGVIHGENQLRAMISAPNGKTYFVKKGVLLGNKKGVIRKITESAVVVREKITNVLGDLEDV